MNREDALKKIKKCLALGRSAETHEAAAAMRQAQALMRQFQVTEREMSMVDVSEARAKAASTAVNNWECWLASNVADAFACETFTTLVGRYNEASNFVRTRFYVFIGIDGAADVAAYAFEVLCRQCARARLAHIAKQPKNCKPTTKTARGDAFAEGWVLAVEKLVERFATGEKNEALLIAYKTEKYPHLGTAKVRNTAAGKRLDAGHYFAGRRAGESAELNRGVGAFAPKGLLA